MNHITHRRTIGGLGFFDRTTSDKPLLGVAPVCPPLRILPTPAHVNIDPASVLAAVHTLEDARHHDPELLAALDMIAHHLSAGRDVLVER